MKITYTSLILLSFSFLSAQSEKDTIKQKDIQEITVIARKPSVESKVDRTVFNVANSSILAGNTTWDVLQMTPLVSIDNNDAIKAENQSVTVYINDRKTVFTGKELKEYLKTLPAENLMKIEVITSPSSRYETSGAVINIVLKKNENEGIKGSATFTNSQSSKNSQYSNLNLNYHKKNFTQTFSASYGNNQSVNTSYNENLLYADHSLTKINTENNSHSKSPAFSSTSELDLNDKNSIGLIVEMSQYKIQQNGNAVGEKYINDVFQNSYFQDQNYTGTNKNLGSNLFYKYYDKVKNKIFDLNAGFNYFGQPNTNNYIKTQNNIINPTGTSIISNSENREYYLKADYTQPLGENGGQIEFGGKANFRNNVMPKEFFNLTNNQWISDDARNNSFNYSDNLNSVYANFSKTFFKKLETRIGLRYEHIHFKLHQEVGNIKKSDSYGTFLPNLLLKYSFNDNYNLTANYNHSIWRPWFTEFNPFLLPEYDGNYSRGNMDLKPNPSDQFSLKLGLYKKYFISARYWFTNQDYWDSYYFEDGKTISMPTNFEGRVESYSLNFSTNQTFIKNKLTANLNIGFNYTDNSDFNEKNSLGLKNYITNFNANSNFSYTNLFNKNINLNAWIGYQQQNNGNTLANKSNIFHTISATKIFPKLEMEATVRLNNIFLKPGFDGTTYTPIGTFRSSNIWNWYGFSFSLVKRFGNQKVKANSKTDVEKESGGGK